VRQETIMKAIIVGGGIMGLATAWALARDGHEVELLEQGALPNPLASSMDEHRLIRHPYGDRRGYARMIDDAYAAWDLLWTDLGQRLYAPTGTLALTGNGETWAARSAEALAGIGKPMTELRLADLPRRFPQLDTKDVERAFWIDTGGVLFAQDIVAALARHLAQTIDQAALLIDSDQRLDWQQLACLIQQPAQLFRTRHIATKNNDPARFYLVEKCPGFVIEFGTGKSDAEELSNLLFQGKGIKGIRWHVFEK